METALSSREATGGPSAPCPEGQDTLMKVRQRAVGLSCPEQIMTAPLEWPVGMEVL